MKILSFYAIRTKQTEEDRGKDRKGKTHLKETFSKRLSNRACALAAFMEVEGEFKIYIYI